MTYFNHILLLPNSFQILSISLPIQFHVFSLSQKEKRIKIKTKKTKNQTKTKRFTDSHTQKTKNQKKNPQSVFCCWPATPLPWSVDIPRDIPLKKMYFLPLPLAGVIYYQLLGQRVRLTNFLSQYWNFPVVFRKVLTILAITSFNYNTSLI